MTKPELRKKYIQLRNALTEAEYVQLNAQLCDSFFSNVDLNSVTVFHTFLPIEKKREPNTLLIVDRIRRDFPAIRISIPKLNVEAQSLEHVYFDGHLSVQNNSWGIPEIAQGIATAVEEIDMVIIPLLAFDQSGHRIGYGKGYYDKFLARCGKEVRKVGLSLFSAETQIEGLEAHDIALDCCVTPNRMYNF